MDWRTDEFGPTFADAGAVNRVWRARYASEAPPRRSGPGLLFAAMPPRSRPRSAKICADFAADLKSGHAQASGGQERSAMNLRAGWVVSAGLLFATTANAEMLAPHQVGGSPYLRQASDF